MNVLRIFRIVIWNYFGFKVIILECTKWSVCEIEDTEDTEPSQKSVPQNGTKSVWNRDSHYSLRHESHIAMIHLDAGRFHWNLQVMHSKDTPEIHHYDTVMTPRAPVRSTRRRRRERLRLEFATEIKSSPTGRNLLPPSLPWPPEPFAEGGRRQHSAGLLIMALPASDNRWSVRRGRVGASRRSSKV